MSSQDLAGISSIDQLVAESSEGGVRGSLGN